MEKEFIPQSGFSQATFSWRQTQGFQKEILSAPGWKVTARKTQNTVDEN